MNESRHNILYTNSVLCGFYIGAVRYISFSNRKRDSAIDLLKERITSLSEKIEMLESQTPDALAKGLSNRVERQLSEISRLREDGEQDQEEISFKESEINEARERLFAFSELIKDFDLVFPECGAPLTRIEFYTISGFSGGREMEADVEYVQYDCGLTIKS